jgi:hypothetical protein
MLVASPGRPTNVLTIEVLDDTTLIYVDEKSVRHHFKRKK